MPISKIARKKSDGMQKSRVTVKVVNRVSRLPRLQALV